MDCLETNKQENCKRSARKMTSLTKKRCEFKFKKEKRPKLNIRDHLNVNDKIESLCNSASRAEPQLDYQGCKTQSSVRIFTLFSCIHMRVEGKLKQFFETQNFSDTFFGMNLMKSV